MQYAFQAFNVAKRLYHYYIVFDIKRNLLTHEINIYYDINQRTKINYNYTSRFNY